MPKPKKSLRRLLITGLLMVLGALLVAVGLELFLVPNRLIDGGIVGIAIMSAHVTRWPLGLFLVLLNLPFLWVGYRQIGQTFALSTLFAIGVMSAFVMILHPVPVFTQDLLLSALFGGISLGLGVGIIIRSGGSLDGTEIMAILIARKVPFSVGEIVMFFNLFILGSAGFLFGWDHAMYSLVAYFVAFKAIDVAIQGLNESKSVIIITARPEQIRDAILQRLGRGVTEWVGKGGYSQEEKTLLYCVVTRLELAKLRGIVQDFDDQAFVVIEDVHEVMGGRFAKRAIH